MTYCKLNANCTFTSSGRWDRPPRCQSWVKKSQNGVQHISTFLTLLIIWTLVSNRRRVPWIASCLPTSSSSWNLQMSEEIFTNDGWNLQMSRKFHKSWTWKVPPLGSFAAHRKSSTTSSLSNQLAWINEIPWLHYHDDPDDDDYHDDPDDEDYHDPLDHLTSKFPHVRHPWLPATNRGRFRLLPDSPAGTIAIGSVFIIWHLSMSNLLDDELQLQFVGNAQEIRSWRFERLYR